MSHNNKLIKKSSFHIIKRKFLSHYYHASRLRTWVWCENERAGLPSGVHKEGNLQWVHARCLGMNGECFLSKKKRTSHGDKHIFPHLVCNFPIVLQNVVVFTTGGLFFWRIYIYIYICVSEILVASKKGLHAYIRIWTWTWAWTWTWTWTWT